MLTVIDRVSLAERWGKDRKTIENYEKEGVITRLRKFPSPHYSLKEIEEIESDGRDNLLQRKNKEIQGLKAYVSELEQKIDRVKGAIL
ncbi:MAG: transcription factor [Clostridiaceae bacterium]